MDKKEPLAKQSSDKPASTVTGRTQEFTANRKSRRGQRITGAEAKRRKKAREAQAALAADPMIPRIDNTADPCKRPVRPKSSEVGLHAQNEESSKSKKRQRSQASSEPSPQLKKKRDVKGKIINPAVSYRDAASGQLRVAVIDSSNPLGKLDAQKAKLVQADLWRALDSQMASTSTEFPDPPTFASWSYAGEILRITCNDEASLNWLKKAVTKVVPWADAILEVVTQDNLPKLSKATLWIPKGAIEEPENRERVLHRLAYQNPKLKVRQWCIFHHAKKEDGELFVFGVGKEDVEMLKGSRNKLNYMFQALALKIKDATSESGEEMGVGARGVATATQVSDAPTAPSVLVTNRATVGESSERMEVEARHVATVTRDSDALATTSNLPANKNLPSTSDESP